MLIDAGDGGVLVVMTVRLKVPRAFPGSRVPFDLCDLRGFAVLLRNTKHRNIISGAVLISNEMGCTPYVRQKVKTHPWPFEKSCCFRLDHC